MTMPDDSRLSIPRFEPVTVSFDGELALEDLSFEAFQGESRVILGAAGSGKTVLLKAALGLVKPDSGKVYAFTSPNAGEAGFRKSMPLRQRPHEHARTRFVRDPQQDRDAVPGERAVRFAQHRGERGLSAAEPKIHPVPAGSGASAGGAGARVCGTGRQ